jgi:hypothetical protein
LCCYNHSCIICKSRWVKKKLEENRLSLDLAKTAAEEIRKNNALLRFYYKQDPEEWDDDKWAMRVEEMEFIFKYMELRKMTING